MFLLQSFMEEQKYLDKLDFRGIHPTAMRLLVLRTMMDAGTALSLTDLEDKLDTADKSTLFRTVTLFHEHHLVHCIDDGTGAVKYAVCADECDCSVEDQHAHFYCIKCHKTFCFKGLPVPIVNLPTGFELQDVNYVIKGLCPNCSGKK